MRLLANENLPRVAVDMLRLLGHDVLWIAEECPSVRDEYVLDLAVRESRVLLTQDKDFGELAFRRGLPATSGGRAPSLGADSEPSNRACKEGVQRECRFLRQVRCRRGRADP